MIFLINLFFGSPLRQNIRQCEEIFSQQHPLLLTPHFQKSLKVRTRDRFPYDWAMTQNNLGTVYLERIRGQRHKNLETAINCFQESFQTQMKCCCSFFVKNCRYNSQPAIA